MKKTILLILVVFIMILGPSKTNASLSIHPFRVEIIPELAEEGAKLYFSITCHIEPHMGQRGKRADYTNETYFRAQLASLKKFISMLDTHGVKLTIQSQQPFSDSLLLWENPFKEFEKKGHEIGTHFHEHTWVDENASKEDRLEALIKQKQAVDQLGVQNTSLCGGWSWDDICETAQKAGFTFLDNYKNPKTQRSNMSNHTVFPYEMCDGIVYVSEGQWGNFKKGIPSNPRPSDFDRLTRMLNKSLFDTETHQICTANVVMHLCDFPPMGDDKIIKLYDEYFSKVLKPAVDKGVLVYSTISESGMLYKTSLDDDDDVSTLIPQEKRIDAEDFTLLVVDPEDNNEIFYTLSDNFGKIILLDFTATWCYWCESMEPQEIEIRSLYDHETLSVISLFTSDSLERILDKYPLGKPWSCVMLLDSKKTTLPLYDIQGYPTYILIDKKGKIAQQYIGAQSDFTEQIKQAIEELQQEKYP